MTLPGIGFVAFGSLWLVLALAHEVRWLGRRRHQRLQGVVLENIKEANTEGVSYFPQVEYEHDGQKRVFVSRYGLAGPLEKGTVVKVVASPQFENVEVESVWNRIGATIVLLIFGLLFVFIGLSIRAPL